MNCKFCKEEMSDFSFKEIKDMSKEFTEYENVDHFFCNNCRSHYFRGKWFNKEQWGIKYE